MIRGMAVSRQEAAGKPPVKLPRPSGTPLMSAQAQSGGASRPERAGRVASGSIAASGRGRYFTLTQMVEAYPVFTPRLVRRLVQQRRIPFSRAGRVIVIAEGDIEAYLEGNRIEPPETQSDWDSVA